MNNSTQAENKNRSIYNWVTEALGWYGVVAVVLAYALLSFKILSSDSLLFQGLNLTGSIGIVIDALDDKNTQPAVLNIIWAIIALVAIVKILI
ncbi:MAG: transporter [bacterium]